MLYDILIKNVEIIDGTGAPAWTGSVAMKDGTLVLAAEDGNAAQIIEGSGLTLAPGFIDVHSHGDMVAGHDYARLCKISQGITTEIAGQCGTSCFPVTPESKSMVVSNAIILGDDEKEHLEEFTNLDGYKKFLAESSLSSNMMTFMGHSTLRLSVMGPSDAKPNDEQIETMRELLEEAMKQGCAGLSTGLFYPPSAYADVDEVAALCEIVAKYGGIHTTHIRNEGSEVLKSIEEVLEVSRRTGVALNISHHKVCGRKNWGLTKETLALIEQARSEGIQVTLDVYPYLASMTKLAACIPTEYFVKGTEWLQDALKDRALRDEIKEKMENFEDGRYRQCGGFTGVMIGGCPTRPEADGKFISDYAAEIGEDPFEVFFDMVIENGGQCSAIYFTMCEEDLDRIVSMPFTMIGTDGLTVSLEGKTHPRGWASFPRAIRLFVREKKLLTMEEMIHRITGLAAEVYQIPNKGMIAEGYDADLVLFHKDEIGDAADFSHSNLLCTGIKAVIVGGKIAYEDGTLTEECPGKWIGLGGRR
ncbi:MAG: D-aminoacylase [Lachnospiraceae bacterium]|nr:D-aminoacylase [Lachnospiraceae bacterium]